MFTKKKAQGILMEKGKTRRLLIVDVIEGRGLVIGDAKRGQSDSYVECSLLDLGDREIKSETYRTHQIRGTLTPTYDQRFTLGISPLFMKTICL